MQTTPPFEPLEFPLSTNTIEQMIDCMPNDYKEIINDCLELVNQNSDVKNKDGQQHRPNNTNNTNISNSIANDRFPLTILEGESDDDEDETESAMEEDPNDPEWSEPQKKV